MGGGCAADPSGERKISNNRQCLKSRNSCAAGNLFFPISNSSSAIPAPTVRGEKFRGIFFFFGDIKKRSERLSQYGGSAMAGQSLSGGPG